MRIAFVAESFLPHMNGVTHSLLRMIDYLHRQGHELLVIAPDPPDAQDAALPVQMVRLPSLPLAGYPSVRVAAGTILRVRRVLTQFQPDVVHIASPFVLGWRAVQAAHELGIPSVSIYQTEVPAYAAKYGMPFLEELLWQRVKDIHSASTVNLVPSTFAQRQLREHGIRRIRIWRRGVDSVQFSPARRDPELRRRVLASCGFSPESGVPIVGFVGRLAAEKQVADLAALAQRTEDGRDVALMIVGEGPLKEELQRLMPNAHFAGFQKGEALGTHVASCDVFVHPGESETFCQTIQEAMAAGVPVVAVGRGGPLDLVEHGATGFLYEPGDLDGMEDSVRRLAWEREPSGELLRERMASAAWQSVQGRTWDSLGEQLEAHYERAIRMNERHLGRTARALLSFYSFEGLRGATRELLGR